jgi:hypothetical protein
MTEVELLLQRFVDNELAPQERLLFLAALDRDPALRRRLLELERLAAEARQLPRTEAAPKFASRVLAQLHVEQPGRLARLRELFWTPRVLEWNLAGALVAACVVVGMAWMLSQAMVTAPAPVPVVERVRSEPKVFVRLVVVQPGARAVAVAGDFNGWSPERTPLQKAQGGVWTTTIPLRPGRYHYMYVIDGQRWIGDPLAGDVSEDGFGSENAVLDVETPL